MNKSTTKELKINSDILGKQMAAQVYLPAEYDNLEELPVLYFLHGRSGDENLLHHLDMQVIADKMTAEGEIVPMIIVCPRMENSRGVNSSSIAKDILCPLGSDRIVNLGRYEDYFIEEIVPLVDKSFKTIKNKKGRFIGGASAGGYAAILYALKYQYMFSRVGAHMPAIELQLEEDAKVYFKDLYAWKENDPIFLCKNNKISSDLSFYLDAGDRDEGEFYKSCAILHDLLKEKGIIVQNHVFPGNHSPAYVLSNIKKYFKFYGSSNI